METTLADILILLAKLPENMQRDLNVHLDAIYATIIINAERLKEIDRKQEEPKGPWR